MKPITTTDYKTRASLRCDPPEKKKKRRKKDETARTAGLKGGIWFTVHGVSNLTTPESGRDASPFPWVVTTLQNSGFVVVEKALMGTS